MGIFIQGKQCNGMALFGVTLSILFTEKIRYLKIVHKIIDMQN